MFLKCESDRKLHDNKNYGNNYLFSLQTIVKKEIKCLEKVYRVSVVNK